MRGLLKIAMVAAMVALFAVATVALSRWWAGAQKRAAVRVVVEPPPARGEVTPLIADVWLYPGQPHRPGDEDVAIDSAEVDLEQQQPNFELTAGEGDGSRFFVHAMVQLSTYESLCESVALPRMRLAKPEGDTAWVDARTGRPLPTLRVAPRERC